MASCAEAQTSFQFLSELLLANSDSSQAVLDSRLVADSLRLGDRGRDFRLGAKLEALKTLAATNHVIVRAFERLDPILQERGEENSLQFVASSLEEERSRIKQAVNFLAKFVRLLNRAGAPSR